MTTTIDYNRETVKIIGDIIKGDLQLSDQQVMLAFQKFNIPTVKGLYIAISYVSGKAIGNNNYFLPETVEESQEVTMHELIQIDVMSFDSSARVRKEEIIASLRGIRSQQMQDKYQLQIARIPGDFLNVSSLEETAYLNRFTITVAVTSLKRFSKFPSYYDTFAEPAVVVNE